MLRKQGKELKMDVDKILYLLGKHYDEWIKDDDWWYGLHNADINVYENCGDCEVTVYGVCSVWGDDGEQYLETDTGVVLDEFTFNGLYEEDL